LYLGPEMTQQRDLSWFEGSRIYDISSDGRVILFEELTYGAPRNPAIYLRKTDGSPAVRLGDGNRPALSPDGKWVACIVSEAGRTVLTLLPTGAGVPRSIGPSGMHYEHVEWFPAGDKILFEGNETNRPVRSYVQDLNGGKAAPLTPHGVIASRISPDGNYAIVASGRKLSLLRVQGGAARPLPDLEPGEELLRWSEENRYLFLQKANGPAALDILRLDLVTGRRQPWRLLTTPDSVGVQIAQVVMTPDGGSYAYSFQRDISTLYLVEGLS